MDVVHGHHDVVTCVAVGEDGRTIVTGSRDTTVMAWELEMVGERWAVKRRGRKVFCGHDEEVGLMMI